MGCIASTFKYGTRNQNKLQEKNNSAKIFLTQDNITKEKIQKYRQLCNMANLRLLVVVKEWYFVTKIVLNYCEKKNSSDREKLLKFEAEGREFPKFLRLLEQFIQTVKGQNNFW